MWGRAVDWWQGLSRRERGLVGFLGILLVAVVVWYAIIVPLQQAREASADRRLAAELRLERLHSTIAARQAIKAPDNVRQAVEQAARQADVYPKLGMGSDGFLSFSLERAPRISGMGWLAGLDQQGVEVTALRIEPHDDGSISLTGSVSNQP